MMKLEVNHEEIKEIINKVKNCNVDVKSTIEKTISSQYMDEDFYIELFDEGTIDYLRQFDNFDLELPSDAFFDFINSKLEEGIYISLAKASPEDTGNNKIFEYNVDDVDEDYLERTGIITWNDGADLLVNLSDGLFIGNMESDFGIELYKKEDSMQLTFCWRGRKCDGPGCPVDIYSIEDELNEPLYYLAIKMMYNAIIFDEST